MANVLPEILDREERGGKVPGIGTKVIVSVTVVLIAVLLLSAGLFNLYERQFFEQNINARAERLLDSLEAVHVQSMLHRSGTRDGDPVINALNDTFQHLSNTSADAKVWLVMGPTVLQYQLAHSAKEIERPRDAVDRAAVDTGKPTTRIVGRNWLRLTRPVVLGEGAAGNERCFACHAALMGAKPGSVLGAYSVNLTITSDREKYLTSTRGALIIAILVSIGMSIVVAVWLKHMVADPLTGMRVAMNRLAGGDLGVNVPDTGRVDEIGDMARSVETLKAKAVETRALERRFAEAQRRATLGEMASGLAHELAQPLATIDAYCSGTLRRLRDGNWDKEQLIEVMQKASGMTHRASAVLRSVAAQASGGQPAFVETSVNQIIEAERPLLEADAERNGVKISFVFGDKLPNRQLDEAGIGSVILNLAHNSIEAMRSNVEGTRQLTIETGLIDSGEVEVSVIDTGPGFDDGTIGRLFDPFFSTKSSGMGMGLAICKSVVEAHGGSIRASRPLDGGAAIHFSLPDSGIPGHANDI